MITTLPQSFGDAIVIVWQTARRIVGGPERENEKCTNFNRLVTTQAICPKNISEKLFYAENVEIKCCNVTTDKY